MAEKTTPFEHARETLTGYYTRGARNDAIDLDADARQLVIDMGHLIAAFHAERIEATAAPGDLAALADDVEGVLRWWENAGQAGCMVLPCDVFDDFADDVRARAKEVRAHRCAPAVEVATDVLDGLRWTVSTPQDSGALGGWLVQGWEDRPHAPSTCRAELRIGDEDSDDPEDGTLAWRVRDLLAGTAHLATPPAPAVPQASEAASGWHWPSDPWAHFTGDYIVQSSKEDRFTDADVNVLADLMASADEVRDAAFRDATPAPAVEVVSGEEAQKLPPGSAIVDERDIELGCNPPARVRLAGQGHMPASWTGPVPGLARAYRVVHRATAPTPVRPLAVGDPVTKVSELESLPIGAVIRDSRDAQGGHRGDVCERVSRGDEYDWQRVGDELHMRPHMPVRVLDLPEKES